LNNELAAINLGWDPIYQRDMSLSCRNRTVTKRGRLKFQLSVVQSKQVFTKGRHLIEFAINRAGGDFSLGCMRDQEFDCLTGVYINPRSMDQLSQSEYVHNWVWWSEGRFYEMSGNRIPPSHQLQNWQSLKEGDSVFVDIDMVSFDLSFVCNIPTEYLICLQTNKDKQRD